MTEPKRRVNWYRVAVIATIALVAWVALELVDLIDFSDPESTAKAISAVIAAVGVRAKRFIVDLQTGPKYTTIPSVAQTTPRASRQRQEQCRRQVSGSRRRAVVLRGIVLQCPTGRQCGGGRCIGHRLGRDYEAGYPDPQYQRGKRHSIRKDECLFRSRELRRLVLSLPGRLRPKTVF